jgi:ABC-2 type transport system ATP-binding protein
MHTIVIEHLAKSFGETRAVIDVSLAVERGEIFGLLGPNGAGKTTTIRAMLGVFKPDGGKVSVLGGPMDEAKKNRIGYMPEERGLYQEITLERCLVYLATLKGLSRAGARRQVGAYLARPSRQRVEQRNAAKGTDHCRHRTPARAAGHRRALFRARSGQHAAGQSIDA